MKVRFEGDGRSVDVTLAPKPEYQASVQLVTPELTIEQRHLLGLTPVLRVSPETDAETAPKQGLLPGDVFARVGAVEYPSVARGIAEIKAHAGRTLDVVVLRRGEDGWREVALTVNVSGEGRVGFLPADTADDSTIVALPMPLGTKDDKGQVQETANPAAEIITRPGVRIAAIEGRPVENFAQVRAALVAAVNSRERPVWVEVQLEPLGEGGKAITRAETRWILDSAEIAQLNGLGWTSPVGAELFEAEQTIVKADGPVAAISKGLKETKRVMLTTYVTFARLFQGTVKVEHLQGPVGIAHLGTMVAEQGWIKLLFFLALISVNLAVINFLPLPIVDGGQFVFLVIEAIRGKPVSERIQGAATLTGLALIGTMFLIVTFHDVMNLLR
jgi:regulator of sigma E protease